MSYTFLLTERHYDKNIEILNPEMPAWRKK